MNQGNELHPETAAPGPKKALTAAVVEKLMKRQIRSKLVPGWILCCVCGGDLFALFGFVVMMRFAVPLPMIIILLLLLGGLAWGIRLVRKGSLLRKRIRDKQYRVEKTECIDFATLSFSNGMRAGVPMSEPEMEPNEPVYMIFLVGARLLAVSAQRYYCREAEEAAARQSDNSGTD